jgi:hypothetical protein
VYVLGGKDDGGVHYAEVSILDTRTWQWNTATPTTGEAPPGLCSHSATAIGRRIFVVGGRRSDGEANRRIYILNTGSYTHTHTDANMLSHSCRHVKLNSRALWLCCAWPTEGMSWTAGPDFPALSGHKACANGEDIFLVGGTSSGQRNHSLMFALRTGLATLSCRCLRSAMRNYPP